MASSGDELMAEHGAYGLLMSGTAARGALWRRLLEAAPAFAPLAASLRATLERWREVQNWSLRDSDGRSAPWQPLHLPHPAHPAHPPHLREPGWRVAQLSDLVYAVEGARRTCLDASPRLHEIAAAAVARCARQPAAAATLCAACTSVLSGCLKRLAVALAREAEALRQVAPLRLCTSAPLRLCTSDLRLCASTPLHPCTPALLHSCTPAPLHLCTSAGRHHLAARPLGGADLAGLASPQAVAAILHAAPPLHAIFLHPRHPPHPHGWLTQRHGELASRAVAHSNQGVTGRHRRQRLQPCGQWLSSLRLGLAPWRREGAGYHRCASRRRTAAGRARHRAAPGTA